MSEAGDTIPVRPDEGFDAVQLAAVLQGRLPGADGVPAVSQFGGGKANLTYLLDYDRVSYVMRRPPLGPVAPSAHDMAREYRVLSVLHRAFPLAPRALYFSDDLSILGAPFFVMERRRGVVVRTRLPRPFVDDPEAPRQMSEALVDALASLHAVDYEALGLGDLGRPEGFIARQVAGWRRRWEATRLPETPELNETVAWLESHVPEAGTATLVHNDFKLDNLMLDPADPGRAVAVFDWDMCTLGDPLSDLGALLAYWSEPEDPAYLRQVAANIMPAGVDGFLSREALVSRYAARSGRDVDAIRFYHVLGLFRVIVILAQIYVRYARGQTLDRRFAGMGELLPPLARAARALARGDLS